MKGDFLQQPGLLTPSEFEQLVAQVLAFSGFSNVVVISGAGDSGVDIRAEWVKKLPTGDTLTTLWAVQCKRYKASINATVIQSILNSVLEPPSTFPNPPDFFLIATT